jgi:hypothetical protein
VPYRRRVEQELASLLRYRANYLRMAMPRGGYSVPSIGVEPSSAVFIDEPGAAATHRDHRKLSVNRKKGGARENRCL